MPWYHLMKMLETASCKDIKQMSNIEFDNDMVPFNNNYVDEGPMTFHSRNCC